MKIPKSFLLLISLLWFLAGTVSAQNHSKMILNYEMVGGKMIVRLLINGQEERFIFDTGSSKSALSTAYVESNNFNFTEPIQIKDANSQSIVYQQVNVNNLSNAEKNMVFENFNAIVLPEMVPIHCYDAVGIIGSDLIEQMQCIINPEDTTITITKSDEIHIKYLRNSHKFVMNGNVPTFMMQVNGEFATALFDTGSSSFITLKHSDLEKLRAKNLVEVIDRGFGLGNIGVSGIEVIDSTYRVKITNLRFGPIRIIDAITETQNVPVSLVGTRLLDYAKVIIDNPRRMIYIVPLNNEPIHPEYKLPNLGISIIDGRLTVSEIWENHRQNISIGDVITHVNDEPTGTYDFCETVSGVDILEGYDPKILTIQTNDEVSIKEKFIYKYLE